MSVSARARTLAPCMLAILCEFKLFRIGVLHTYLLRIVLAVTIRRTKWISSIQCVHVSALWCSRLCDKFRCSVHVVYCRLFAMNLNETDNCTLERIHSHVHCTCVAFERVQWRGDWCGKWFTSSSSLSFLCIFSSCAPSTHPTGNSQMNKTKWKKCQRPIRPYAEKRRNFFMVCAAAECQLRASNIHGAKLCLRRNRIKNSLTKLFSLRFNPLSLGNDDTRIFYLPFFTFAASEKKYCVFFQLGITTKQSMLLNCMHSREYHCFNAICKSLFTETTMWECGWLRFNLFKWMRKQSNENKKPYIRMHRKRQQRSTA